MERPIGYRIDELARRFGLEARGNTSRVIHGVAPLARAQSGHLAFLANPRYAVDLTHTGAGVVLLRSEHADASPVPRGGRGRRMGRSVCEHRPALRGRRGRHN
jgi:UDP-3-O-[3-hydroxymyristoyl] glucosamine N-acyltransferase